MTTHSFYAGYGVRPASGEWDDVYAIFDPDRADFLRRVLASGKEGRIWTSIDPDAVPGEEAVAGGPEVDLVLGDLVRSEEGLRAH